MGPWARRPMVPGPVGPLPWGSQETPRGVGVSLEDIADLEVCSSNVSPWIRSPGTFGAGARVYGAVEGTLPLPPGGGARLSDPGSRIRELGDPARPWVPDPGIGGSRGPRAPGPLCFIARHAAVTRDLPRIAQCRRRRPMRTHEPRTRRFFEGRISNYAFEARIPHGVSWALGLLGLGPMGPGPWSAQKHPTGNRRFPRKILLLLRCFPRINHRL